MRPTSSVQRLWRLAAMATSRCPRMFPGGVLCDAKLTNRKVNGQTEPYCARCARFFAGQCITCGEPHGGVVRKALYCPAHRKLAANAATERYTQAHYAERLAYHRELRRRRRARKSGGLVESPGAVTLARDGVREGAAHGRTPRTLSREDMEHYDSELALARLLSRFTESLKPAGFLPVDDALPIVRRVLYATFLPVEAVDGPEAHAFFGTCAALVAAKVRKVELFDTDLVRVYRAALKAKHATLDEEEARFLANLGISGVHIFDSDVTGGGDGTPA